MRGFLKMTSTAKLRLCDRETLCDRRKFGRAAKAIEHRIKVVHRVTELIEAKVGRSLQAAIGPKCRVLEEAANRLTARQECLIGGVFTRTIGTKHDGFVVRWREFDGELQCAFAQSKAIGRVGEVLNDEEAVFLVTG